MFESLASEWRLGLFALVAAIPFYPAGAQTTATDLAERFAPVLMHPVDEPNLPANVDWFIPLTTLFFKNDQCPADSRSFGQTSLSLIDNQKVISACNGHVYTASGTRSATRSRTFFMSDVSDIYKKGLLDPHSWITYFHIYDNQIGGKTIQYWAFYPYNTGQRVGPIEIGFHGGDWEMVSVFLNSADNPISVHMTGHNSIVSVPWSSIATQNGHPIVYTEKGGHEAHAAPLGAPSSYIVHPTWSGGLAIFPGQEPQQVGNLTDLGTKLHPKIQFLAYSGLWGSPGVTPFSSGYWGPAFNETGMGADNYLAAWCDGTGTPDDADGSKKECYPDDPQ